jgi:hypothetical protein
MTLKCQDSTLFKSGAKMTVRCLAIILAAIRASAAETPCVLPEITPGGNPAETRFVAAPVPRVHEVISDAMQAAGVFLFKDTQESLEGERTTERVGPPAWLLC